MATNIIKLIILFLLITVNASAAPSNSMSISPSAVSGATASAADENARNNEVSTKYNAHTHNDISTLDNTVNIGDGNAGDKTINANTDDANKPYIKWDDTNEIWVSSRDGVTVETIMIMTGADLSQSIIPQSPSDNQHIQYDSLDDAWEASNDIDIDSGSIDGATLGANSQVTITDADMNGGTIDGVPIGNSSTSAGSFSSFNSQTSIKGSIMIDDGSSMIKFSPGTDGQFLQTQGSNLDPVWGSLSVQYKGVTAMSATTNSGDITISDDKRYRVLVEGINAAAASNEISLRFNSQSDATDYDYKRNVWYYTATADTTNESTGDTRIILSSGLTSTGASSNSMFKCDIFIDTSTRGTRSGFISGSGHSVEGAGAEDVAFNVWGFWNDNEGATSFEIVASQNFTGNIYLYEYALSP